MRAVKRKKNESLLSEFLPSVTISGYVSEQDNTKQGSDSNFKPAEQSLLIEQKIFQGLVVVLLILKKKIWTKLGRI